MEDDNTGTVCKTLLSISSEELWQYLSSTDSHIYLDSSLDFQTTTVVSCITGTIMSCDPSFKFKTADGITNSLRKPSLPSNIADDAGMTISVGYKQTGCSESDVDSYFHVVGADVLLDVDNNNNQYFVIENMATSDDKEETGLNQSVDAEETVSNSLDELILGSIENCNPSNGPGKENFKSHKKEKRKHDIASAENLHTTLPSIYKYEGFSTTVKSTNTNFKLNNESETTFLTFHNHVLPLRESNNSSIDKLSVTNNVSRKRDNSLTNIYGEYVKFNKFPLFSSTDKNYCDKLNMDNFYEKFHPNVLVEDVLVNMGKTLTSAHVNLPQAVSNTRQGTNCSLTRPNTLD